MPGCAALGCSNRTETGHSLKSFPRDPQRRALWTTMVNRKNWIPKNSSYICEIHFDDNQWEIPRVDGKKKLKANAVPTIFDFSIKKKPYSKKKQRNIFNGKNSFYEDGNIKGQLPLNGLECLVCHSMLHSDDKICADSITATTGVTMKQRLRQITNAVSHKQWKSRRKGSLCHRCAQLINYVDKMESELALLKSALADCILVKGDRHELTEEFVTNLLVLDEFQSRLPELSVDEEMGDCLELC
ncbi:hypothetical protein J437_LFUL016358 [Ladona fulva]|uniref:THAP-type domain-containing protein n=1 Tax=Ladona fulva TaxID=123851 RepID=A0A8K0KNZ8_LADFU|nr:hypothetical protein J437_LFUL016358 [Ladona fulva]